MRYCKTITPIDGNFLGELFDGPMLIHDKEYSSYSVAEQAMDALIVELLLDQCEQGLIDDLILAMAAESVTSTQLPNWPIDTDHAPLGWTN